MAKGFGPRKPKKGSKKRQKAYTKLIFALLHCPRGKEPEILMANQNLVDAGLVKMMGMVAMMLAKEGDRQSANFLINLANLLAEKLRLSGNFVEFPHFLLQMMLAMRSNGNPEAAYPILQKYLEQDNLFIQRFRSWATAMLYDVDPEQAHGFAAIMATFGSLIAEFRRGDRAQNVEEAIACHQAVLQVITRDTNPELWGDIQDRLATAYCNRIKGDQAENLENAINAYEKALQVLTREASPEQWGKIQNNLGNAYRDRIWGEKSENLERAIAAHLAALQVRTRDAYPEQWAMTQMNLAADYRHRIKGEKAKHQEMAIACYQQALQVYTAQAFPKAWAEVHNNLGNVYCDRLCGDKSENLDKAIAAFKASLQVFTRQSFPHSWALTQMNLGNAYQQQEKIPEAISCCRAALEIWTPTDFPQNCFQAGRNVGHAAFNAQLWPEAIEGYTAAIEAVEQLLAWADSESRRQEILAEAIHIYEQMVKACANNSQIDLARQYAQRSGSQRLLNQLINNDIDQDQEVVNFIFQVLRVSYESSGEPQVVYRLVEANLDKLDDKFLRGLRGLRQYVQSQVEPEQVAQMFQQLTTSDPSHVYPESSVVEAIHTAIGMVVFKTLILQFSKGNRATNIEIAIAASEVIDTVFTREALPEQWAVGQFDLGAAYRNRIRGDRKSNIEQAIAYYHNALQVFTRESSPERWGDTQNNLAIAYSYRIQGDRSENQEQAIAYAKEVLQVCTPDTFREQWGNTQMNLGSFYLERFRDNRAENLEEAIRYYKAAEQVLTREAFPKNWGMIQDGLGLSYLNRIKGDPAENLEQALDYFQAALQVRTPDASRVDWVTTQSNLGNTYWQRIKGDKAENLESAIYCYEAALRVATLETMPEQWAMAQINLGGVLSERIKGNRVLNLEASIRCREAALQVYTRRAFPQNWATLQNNLGLTYGNLRQYQAAIHCFQAALEVSTREAFPADWADTQYNLGLAYRNVEQIDKAIECFRLSLEIYKPTAFPLDCLRSGRCLGDAVFDIGRWAEAIEGYSLAIEAVETSRIWTTSESRRQEILAQAIDVYENMVQACINAGQLDKAIEYVERSRSKRLVDLMASNDLYRSGEIPPEVKELLQQYEDLQQRIDQERSQNDSGNSRTTNRASFQAYKDTIKALEAEKQQIWEQLRRVDPVLAGEIKVDAPDFAAMQQLIDQPTTAILSFYTTDNDTHIFILRQNQISVHTCLGQGIETLQGWIYQNWLKPYAASYNPDKPKPERDQLRAEWIDQISPFLAELSQKLQLTDLIAKHLDGIEELIIVPHLLLHQIPLAALPILHPPCPPLPRGGLGVSSGDRRERGGGEGSGVRVKYLADKFLIRYTPSCQVLEFCQQRGEVGESFTYGIVEDAEDNLPFASFEGKNIAQLYNIPESQRLRGSSQATRQKYRQLAAEVQGLHSCHHAESCLDNPLNSKLKLGDGSITLGQLMTPGWRLPHLWDVFLSCCETGLGLPEITDDILTLSTGFLCAGARSVVSTLWSVDDLATALFSIFYYQHRQQGKTRPESLQQAQILLRELKKEELLKREDIKELSKQAEAGRKEARSKRNQYQPGSADYLKWDSEYSKYARVTTQIHALKSSQEECPFSHPRFWAAFTCQGLR